jgi:hypothetical protein
MLELLAGSRDDIVEAENALERRERRRWRQIFEAARTLHAELSY